jgi:hypothetical protein
MKVLTVSSIFTNLQQLAIELAPRSGQALLGARLTFAFPRTIYGGECLTEFSLPFGSERFETLLARRTGLTIAAHGADEEGDLYRFVEEGRAAIAAVDSFYLPYRPAFGRVHSHRTLIVRRAPSKDDVWVEDPWPPAFVGSIPVNVFDQARHSKTVLCTTGEPIFAGAPVEGEWWSLDLIPLPMRSVSEWASLLLCELSTEAGRSSKDLAGDYGLAAWRLFAIALERCLASRTHAGNEWLRQASLLLRVELSARVFLCAFLKAAATWTDGAFSAQPVEKYYAELRHFEIARDVLTKSLTHFKDEYAPWILKNLAAGIEADYRLADHLQQFSVSYLPAQALTM